MWHDRHADPKEDSSIAKRLRNAFIIRNCRAAYIEIEDYESKGDLEQTERQILAIAEPHEKAWNSSFDPPPEPKALVDEVISDLNFGRAELEALARQNARYLEAVK